MVRKELQILLEGSIKELQKEKAFPVFDMPEIKLEYPENRDHGDYASNIAMVLAKQVRKSPKEVADLLILKLKTKDNRFKIESAGPRFINFIISKDYLEKKIEDILGQKDKFGGVDAGRKEKINIEFISANPTGPLTMGNARGGFCGDVLANVLNKAGYNVSREYYINNMGKQIDLLKDSLGGKSGYNNQYINTLKSKNEKNVKKALDYIVGETKKTTQKMGIKFDKWFYESDLYKSKETEKVLKILEKKNLVYKKDDAIWFKSSQFGDDKDRVLIRKNDKETYFLSDIAYLSNKFKRGFKKLIIFLGADHYGYVGRMKAAAEALGYEKKQVDLVIMQLVSIMWAESEGPKKVVRMSKRKGVYKTIEELIGEKAGEGLGLDVARFFFLLRSPGSHLVFDLDLAKQQSKKNPVFYVQYAYARISSILKKAKAIKSKLQQNNLREPSELNLAKLLIRLPEVVEDTSRDYQVQRLPQYAMELATSFHKFYQDCRVISEDKNIVQSRLTLVLATRIVLKNTLELMGVSAPEKM
ncbi:MAG: arginine--tRNA ligase [Candidatus Nealsonbacteria bacterium]